MSLRLVRILGLALILAAAPCLVPVPSAAQPKTDPAKLIVRSVTLQAKDMPLSRVLQAVQGKTGIAVRRGVPEDPKLDLDLQKVPFWKALDDIARAANLRVSLYQKDHKIALVAGPYQEVPTCYSGPFRITLKKLTATRDLETGARTCVAKLEVAWQPPFQPFLVETQPQTFVLKDDQMHDHKVSRDKVLAYAAGDHLATDVDLTLPTLERGVPHIGLFKGSLRMVGAAQPLTFTFDNLAKGKNLARDAVAIEMQDFRVEKAAVNEKRWIVKLALAYPPSTFRFESFQIGSWLGRSQAVLVSRKTGQRYTTKDFEPEAEDKVDKAVIIYRFSEDTENKKFLDEPADWKLEYTTMGPVLEVPIDFEFKDVPLP
jgi:hypothetical protein